MSFKVFALSYSYKSLVVFRCRRRESLMRKKEIELFIFCVSVTSINTFTRLRRDWVLKSFCRDVLRGKRSRSIGRTKNNNNNKNWLSSLLPLRLRLVLLKGERERERLHMWRILFTKVLICTISFSSIVVFFFKEVLFFSFFIISPFYYSTKKDAWRVLVKEKSDVYWPLKLTWRLQSFRVIDSFTHIVQGKDQKSGRWGTDRCN